MPGMMEPRRISADVNVLLLIPSRQLKVLVQLEAVFKRVQGQYYKIMLVKADNVPDIDNPGNFQ